jgi:hypothetical protein
VNLKARHTVSAAAFVCVTLFVVNQGGKRGWPVFRQVRAAIVG